MRETRAGHHDDVGGAGRTKARCVLMNITDLAKVGARALQDLGNCGKRGPKGASHQDTSKGPAS